LVEEKTVFEKLPSSVSGVNQVLPSGYLPSIPYNFFGKYLSGKSLLTLQESTWICSQTGGNVLILDVDGGYELFLREWLPILQARFDFTGNVHVLPCFNTQRFDPRQKVPYFDLPVFGMFGVKSQVSMSKNGKADFSSYAPCASLVEDYINRKGVKVVVIDSYSQIFKDVFQGMEAFGERARAEDFLFSLVKGVCYRHKVFVFLNHHHSVNPISNDIKIAGGQSVLQNCKVALYLSKQSEKENKGTIWVYRYPNVVPFSRQGSFEFSDIGIT
jgi:hypothetical protein